jgi:hypothetical protein
MVTPAYHPRDPSRTVLYQVIADHLEPLLATLDADPTAKGLPGYDREECYASLQEAKALLEDHPGFDAAIEAASKTPDVVKRRAAYDKAQRIIAMVGSIQYGPEELPPAVTGSGVSVAHRLRLRNPLYTALDGVRTAGVERTSRREFRRVGWLTPD